MVKIIIMMIMIIVKNNEYGEGDNSFLVVVAMNTISDSHSNLGVDTSIPIVVVPTESLLMFGG